MPKRDSEAARCKGAHKKDHFPRILHDQPFRGLPVRRTANKKTKNAIRYPQDTRKV